MELLKPYHQIIDMEWNRIRKYNVYGVNRIFEHGNEEKQTNANGNHNFFPNCFQSIKVQLRGAEQRRVGRGNGFNEAERSLMTSNWCHHIIKHFLH